MERTYQLKRMKSYVLPEPVYRQALWAVKDLNRLRMRLEQVRAESEGPRTISLEDTWIGMGASVVSDRVAKQATEIVHLSERILAIEKSFYDLPEKYREGIEKKLVEGIPYDEDFAHMNTWKKWQQIFIYGVANRLNLI